MPLPKKSVAKKTTKKPEVSEPEMTTFVCSACKVQFADTGLYFYGVASLKCIWCKKFPSRNISKG